MQFVNNDMDELFRQAAKDYPLKTDSGDWNAVLNKMQGENNNSDKKNNGAKYLFLLLLIPLLIVCTTYIKNDSTAGNEKTKTVSGDYTSVKNAEKNKDIVKKTSLKETTVYETGADSENTNEVPVSIKGKNTASLFDRNRFIAENNSVVISRKLNEASLSPNFGKTNDKPTIQDTPNANDPFNTNSIVSNNKQNENTSSTKTQEQNNFKENADIIENTQTPAEVKTDLEKPEDALVSANSNKKEKQPKTRSNKFYFGFQLGPDFTMVKSMNIDGTGYSAGLIAGYNIKKKFAIETGLLWDHKQYQSEGRHFSTKKLNWPYVYLLDVSGFCNMYEIPLNLRYSFSQNTRRTLFATAGVSSYLMKKENYDYSYRRNGIYGYGNREYKNTVNNWLSIAHVSVGIQKKLGAIGDLRVEPYIKLPLYGVGIGSMPLRSTGVYLGITRPIH